MPTTRAQSRGQSRALPLDVHDSSDEDSDSDSSDTSSIDTLLRGGSKLLYDISQLSPSSVQRAKQAFTGQFAVDNCEEKSADGPEKYYAFEVSETIKAGVIRIGPPGSKWTRPSCSCGGPQACHHVFWLLDQVAGRFLPHHEESPYVLQKDGIVSSKDHPFDQISRLGLDVVAQELRSSFQRQHNSPTVATLTHRLHEVRDILATLAVAVALDHDHNIFDQLPSAFTAVDILVPIDLDTTLARTIIINDDVFQFLGRLISAKDRTTDLFSRLGEKAHAAITLLDQYAEVGQGANDNIPHDVTWCAATLVDVVTAIAHELDERAPLAAAARHEAAQVLVSILASVVNHKHDMGPRGSKAGRSLYQHLMVMKNGAAEGFSIIVDTLYGLADAAGPAIDDLEDILDEFDADEGSVAYERRLRRLYEQFKAAGSKRQGGNLAGSAAKRMK